MEHYYTATSTEDKRKEIEYYIEEEKIKFDTSNAVFSKKMIDFGTRTMIETVLIEEKVEGKKILDIGCGYGAVGITLGVKRDNVEIIMCDINERAVELAKSNVIKNNIESKVKVYVSDLYKEVNEMDFDFILSNPPIRAGKKVIYRIYREGVEHLKRGGIIYVVIQKKQGAGSTIKELKKIYGNCEVVNKKKGYLILKSIKKE